MTSLAKDTKATGIRISRLDDYIQAFDSVLDRIQKVMPLNLKVYDRIVEARDAVFRLQQQMRDCEIVEFCSSGLDEVIYENTLANILWDQTKQEAYDNEIDETLKDSKEDDD